MLGAIWSESTPHSLSGGEACPMTQLLPPPTQPTTQHNPPCPQLLPPRAAALILMEGAITAPHDLSHPNLPPTTLPTDPPLGEAAVLMGGGPYDLSDPFSTTHHAPRSWPSPARSSMRASRLMTSCTYVGGKR